MGSAAKRPTVSVTLLRCHPCQFERLDWRRCTSARSARHATSATKDARTAEFSADASDLVQHARIVTNQWRWRTYSNRFQVLRSRHNLTDDGAQHRLSGQEDVVH
jgi:hypothetical protein